MNRRNLARAIVSAGALLAAVAGSILLASATGWTSSAGATVNTTTRTSTAIPEGSESRQAQPAETAQTLRQAGLTPEHLAAAGVTRLEFDALADAATVYCMQADRVAAFARASRNLNILKANATKVPARRVSLGENAPTTIAQARGQLDDLRADAFTFITTGLAVDKKVRLATIRSNADRPVPAPYRLLTGRTDKQWLELRNALSAMRIAQRTGKPAPPLAITVTSAAEADTEVSASRAGYETNLAIIRSEWKIKLPARAGDAP